MTFFHGQNYGSSVFYPISFWHLKYIVSFHIHFFINTMPILPSVYSHKLVVNYTLLLNNTTIQRLFRLFTVVRICWRLARWRHWGFHNKLSTLNHMELSGQSLLMSGVLLSIISGKLFYCASQPYLTGWMQVMHEINKCDIILIKTLFGGYLTRSVNIYLLIIFIY